MTSVDEVGVGGAERLSDSHLAGSLRHGEPQHPVHADQRDEEREQAEDRNDQRQEPCVGTAASTRCSRADAEFPPRFELRPVRVLRRRAVPLPSLPAACARPAGRDRDMPASSARRTSAWPLLRAPNVWTSATTPTTCLVRRPSRNRSPIGLRPLHNLFAIVWLTTATSGVPSRSSAAEPATADQMQAKSVECRWTGNSPIRIDGWFGVRNPDIRVAVRRPKRIVSREANRQDTRNRCDSSRDFLTNGGGCTLAGGQHRHVCCARHWASAGDGVVIRQLVLDSDHHDRPRVEAKIECDETGEAVDEEAGAGQQHQHDRDFRRRQQGERLGKNPVAAACGAAGAAQSVDDASPRGQQCGHQRGHARREENRREGEQQGGNADTRFVQPGHRRADGHERSPARPGQRNSQDAARDRENRAFGQQLTSHPQRPRAKGEAGRELAGAGRSCGRAPGC